MCIHCGGLKMHLIFKPDLQTVEGLRAVPGFMVLCSAETNSNFRYSNIWSPKRMNID